MKIYKPKKWLTVSRMFITLFFVLFVSSATFNKTTITTTKNENLYKALNYEVITNYQELAYTENLYQKESSFIGSLTGYAGDCPLCSGVVACKPRINVLEEGIYFKDEEYGTIRMVASSKNYPCGTILRFNNSRISEYPIIAVVMDRGVSGNNIDLLMQNESEARQYVGRVRNLEFDILRLGWN